MKKKECIVVLLLIFGISQIFAATCGDVNNDGVADIIDALLVSQFYVGLDPQPFDQSVGDVNEDSSIDIIDGLLIAQFYVGLIPELDCGETTTPTPIPAPTPTIDPNAPIGPAGYIYCADEGVSVTFDVEVNAAYGADGSFNYLYGVSGTITFDNDTFGDPIHGTVKHGFYQETGPPTPTPVPTETPGPTASPGPTAVEGLIAFPGAEGYGKVSTGGRGGKLYIVTTLSSSGSGSLGEALGASGPRTVVFRVGGTIDGNFSITNDDITVAGQTAPGDGIAINGKLFINANNVILRYFRVRGKCSDDTVSNGHGDIKFNQVYDHISANWSSDEIFSVYFHENVTIQYCMITEAGSSGHKFGGIMGGNHNSIHHNLFAHNTSRNPRIASGAGYNDIRNNVIFNTGSPIHGGEKHQVGDSRHAFQSCNVVANYIKPGPVNPNLNICGVQSRDGMNDAADWYITGNVLHGNAAATADNWKAVSGSYYYKLSSPSEYMPINQQTAEDAFQTVLDQVGCAMPHRDSLDARIIEEVRTGNVQNGNGLVSSPGTLPSLASGTPPTDNDMDGMADDWEIANGLDPNNPNDGNTTDSTGYTMLENYINTLDNF